MKKQITIKEAQEKYGIVVSKMQRYNKYKFYLCENGNVVDSDGDTRYIAPMSKITKQKLEALIRHDIENMPYKFRDLHSMFMGGIPAYKDFTKKDIEEYFNENELEITKEDKEWASFNK